MGDYKAVQTDQTRSQADATTDRANLEAAVKNIVARRREIQFCADAQWPASNPAKAGSLTNIVDNENNVIEYAYNDLGQVVAMADPDMGVWQYRRDFAGRLREQVDAKNQLVRFNYDDPLGRLRSRQVFDYTGAFVYGVTNFYDSSDDANFTVYAGQLYKTTDSEGWQKNGYDVRGRTVKTARYLSKNGNTYTNQFACDDQDRVASTVYPNGGPTVTNIYDTGGNLSQVKQVGESNTVFYAATGFNALGQLLGINFGNGVATANSYFANSHRVQRVTTAKSGSTNIQDLTYSYDKVSNLKSIADGVYITNASAALSSIVYDDLHRLTSLTRPAVSQTTTFSYSPIGNITVNGEAGAGTYDYKLRMPHAVKSANGKSYAYDANGNMIVRGAQQLSYDAENRLIQVGGASYTSPITFGYDGSGARLWKQGATNLQVWIDGNYEEKQGKVLFHVLAGRRLVCTFDATGTNVFDYYHPDTLHSTAILTDANGNRRQHYEYTAFGQDRFTESSTAFPLSRRYTSQVLDEDTRLYYYGARYYDPPLARFVQLDTVISDFGNPQSLNRYSYALNNPLRYTDLTGHAADDDNEFSVPLTLSAAHAALRQSAGGASAQLCNKAGPELRGVAAVGKAADLPQLSTFNSHPIRLRRWRRAAVEAERHELPKAHAIAGEDEMAIIRDFVRAGYADTRK